MPGGCVRWFLPKTVDFRDLFDRASANIVEGVRLFRELLEHPGEYSPLVERIKQVEHEGDRITHQTIEKLNTTFITPFDREDIHELIARMDDVLDAVDAAAQRMVLYRIVEIPRHLVRMADILVLSAAELRKAVVAVHDRSKQEEILDHCVEVNRLENDADVLHREALAELFANSTDAITVVKLKDLYAFLEEATDRCEDVVNAIETMIIKAS
jgi:predicted phosphate transport protein (TIGR00153 family)